MDAAENGVGGFWKGSHGHPKCSTAKELRLLIERKGVLEGFVCFCSSKGLTSKSISDYINGLKHFASDLEEVPNIAGYSLGL